MIHYIYNAIGVPLSQKRARPRQGRRRGARRPFKQKNLLKGRCLLSVLKQELVDAHQGVGGVLGVEQEAEIVV